jgi:hypothetical protein
MTAKLAYTITVYALIEELFSRETALAVQRSIHETLYDNDIVTYKTAIKPGIPGDISDELDAPPPPVVHLQLGGRAPGLYVDGEKLP